MDRNTTAGGSRPQYFGRDLEAMSFAANYHRWVLDAFRPYLGRHAAEVGAGAGSFSALLLEQVQHLTAFEPSANMYALLRERFAGDGRVETVNATFGEACNRLEGRLDSVVYVNVLEHVEQDGAELALVHRALRQGGHALLFVPALPFLFSDLDRAMGHVRRYRRDGLVTLVGQAGFTVRKAVYFDCAGIIPWYVAYVLLRRTMTGGQVSLYDRLVVPVMRRIESLVPPAWGKNLLVIAQKA